MQPHQVVERGQLGPVQDIARVFVSVRLPSGPVCLHPGESRLGDLPGELLRDLRAALRFRKSLPVIRPFVTWV